jgi:signal transduction histidine kinase
MFIEQRLQEAINNKQAAERFLDQISHEIRNPISSILLLCDEILSSLRQGIIDTPESTASIVDAAQTIAMCAMHQKSIVDQVLTLSKLDSHLLELVLEPSKPLEIVQSAQKMFTTNLTADGITSTVQVLPSIKELGLDEVLMDSSRIMQVIINLFNNAIKFTRESTIRNITLTIGASRMRPTEGMLPVALVPYRVRDSLASESQAASLLESGTDDPEKVVYLHFSVQDTGCGLTESVMDHLFHRFSQASPRTHKQYGGSGLGLFISRELVELHGGQIGVQSESGVGSNFMFYIKALRTASPSCLTPSVQPSQNLELLPIRSKPPQPKHAKSSGGTLMKSLKHLHVLYVEDNAINRNVTSRQLLRAGCTSVNLVENGLEALVFLETTAVFKSSGASQKPLDVILLDVEMPIMGGIVCGVFHPCCQFLH